MRSNHAIIGTGVCAALLLGSLVGHGQQKAAAPTPLPAVVLGERMDNVDGGKSSLNDFKGKIVLLFVVGKSDKVGDAAGRISSEMGYAFAKKPDFVRITVVELPGFPTVMHSFIHNKAKDQHDKDETEYVGLFKQHGLTFLPRHRATLLLDFDGDFGKNLGIASKVDETYQMYVLDRQGRLLTHLTQERTAAQEAKSLERTRQALTRAFNPPKKQKTN